MENRFGLKDLVLMLLVVVLIVMVGLQMTQYDRQWQLMQRTNEKLEEQTSDLSRIRRLLEQAVANGSHFTGNGTTGPTTNSTQANTDEDPFEREKLIHAAPDFAMGDTVVSTFAVVPDKLTPLISTDLYATIVQTYVVEPLAQRDPNKLDHFTPLLATSWTISEDQLKIDFNLRRGVTFSDGSPMTADDVVFTMEWTMNKEVEDPRAKAYLDKFDHVEKLDDYKVRFVFKEPYFKSFETAAGVGDVGVLSKKFYSQYTPKDFNNSTGLLMGTGPYRLADPKSWKPEPGKPVELIRNERYWGEPSAPKRLVWKVIGNPTAVTTAFRNGETDEVERMEAEQFTVMAADPKMAPPRTQHYALDTPTAGYLYIGWNEQLDGKPTQFADPRVRRAMTMLINRDLLVKDIMRGQATVTASSFSALTPQSDPSVKPLPFDPPAAIKLLEEAGYHKTGGTLTGPDGKEFHFTLAFNSAREERRRLCSYVKDQLAEAGIICDIKPTEWSVLLQQVTERKFDAVCMGWSGGVEEDPHQIFHSDAIAGTGDNFVHYSNKRFDELVDKARSIVDEKKRMPLWHEACRIIADDQPYTFLFADKELTFLDGRFRGLQQTKLGLNGTPEWYVPRALQKYKD